MSSLEVFSARAEDVDAVLTLQERFHTSNVSETERANGFVTTRLSAEQVLRLVNTDGLYCAQAGGTLAGYVVASDWEWLRQWPIFDHMVTALPDFSYSGLTVTPQNSFQYGPICVDTPFRGGEVLQRLYEAVEKGTADRWPVAVTFVNYQNARSMAAHTRKLKLDHIDDFEFNNNRYARLAFLTKK